MIKVEDFSKEEHQHYHEKHLKSLRDCEELIKHQSQSESNLKAQLDFHMLMPCLFNQGGRGSRQVLMNMAHWLPAVLENQVDLGMEFYLTPFTYLEFLDQLKHQSDTADTVLTDAMNGRGKISESFFEDPKSLIWLLALLDGGYDRAVKRPLRIFGEWVDRGLLRKISGLKLPDSRALQKHKFGVHADFLMHKDGRLTKETERDVGDSVFHYRVDAANMWISKILRNDLQTDLFMFTNTAKTLDLMRKQGLARHDQSLASFSKLFQSNDSHLERFHRLGDAIERLNKNLERMMPHPTVADFSGYLMEEITDYYKRIFPAVFPVRKATAAGASGQDLVKQIRELAKDKKRLKDHRDRVKSDIREGARKLHAKVSSGLRHDVWDAFGLADDPIYQGIYDCFDLHSVGTQV